MSIKFAAVRSRDVFTGMCVRTILADQQHGARCPTRVPNSPQAALNSKSLQAAKAHQRNNNNFDNPLPDLKPKP